MIWLFKTLQLANVLAALVVFYEVIFALNRFFRGQRHNVEFPVWQVVVGAAALASASLLAFWPRLADMNILWLQADPIMPVSATAALALLFGALFWFHHGLCRWDGDGDWRTERRLMVIVFLLSAGSTSLELFS